ncbi:MAG TPA: hypothetical protein PK530_05030 [Anaerolineales bacterium]|nr:hypothetical protein [Anaerolineales bacterium]
MVSTLSPKRNLREFASYIWFAALVGLGGVVAFTLFQFALPRPQFVNLGPTSQFQTDQPAYLAIRESGQALFLWVVNLEDGLHVFDARATHPAARSQNCIVEWVPKSTSSFPGRNYFLDPCIGGYWWASGEQFGGPAPRDLDWYASEVREGDLWIDVMNPREGQPWWEKQQS